VNSDNILVVDDSLTVRMDLVDALGAAGLLATPCGTLAEARQRLTNRVVSVVILDLILPDGDGLELLREIRALDHRVAVVMLSSEVEVDARIRGLNTGADEYVGKPYDTGYLIAKVRELLHRQGVESADSGPLLLIDDSVTFRETLSAALRESGHRVITAATGEEGLKLAAAERPKAILVDGMLPGIDGPTVIRHVRLDAALRGIPCVLLTSEGGIDYELKALDAGADAFIHKNEELDVILAKLRVALRATATAKSDAETASLLAPKRILAVDDSPTYREHIVAALRSEGYEVIAARSGEEALELLTVQSVDCILLDVIMPGLDGKETCRRLKESPAVRDIPVVLLTSIEDRASVLEGLATGADDYIQKSAELEVLKARVRAQLRRRQFEDETRRVRERLLKSEIEASEARAARVIAEARAALVGELETKNRDLAAAYEELQATQAKLVQSAKMASLGSLVAGVAHEVNNPLAFVLSHLTTAENNLVDVESRVGDAALEPARTSWARAKDRLGGMRMGLERIQDLVLKLRTFSRLDEGERKIVSIHECIDAVLTILAHRLTNIQVTIEIGEPEVLECMPGLLNQAIMNLVANAADAIEGEGTIKIVTGAEGDHFVIRIEDSGPGIPASLRDRVLDPFFTTKAVGSGTGLGLSITDSIIKKHSGTLDLADAPGGGAAAIIRLPLRRSIRSSP
jgi:two-component system, NtrC family, sensor kinase